MAARQPKVWVRNPGENDPASASALVEAAIAMCAGTEGFADPFLASLAAAAGRPDLAMDRVDALSGYFGRRAVAAASAAVELAPRGEAGPLIDIALAAIAEEYEPGEKAIAHGVLALAFERAGDCAARSADEARALAPRSRWGSRAAVTGLARWHLGRGEAEAAGALLQKPTGEDAWTGLGADPRGFARRVMRAFGRLGAYGLARDLGQDHPLRPWWPARSELLAAGDASELLAMVSERASSADDDDAYAVVCHAAAHGDGELAMRAYATICEDSEPFCRLLPLPELARFDPERARAELEKVREDEDDYAGRWVVRTLAALGDLEAARQVAEAMPLRARVRALRDAPEILDDALVARLAADSDEDPCVEADRLGLLAVCAWRAGDQKTSRKWLDLQLALALATKPSSRSRSFGDAVRDRLAIGDVPLATAVVPQAPKSLRTDLLVPVLQHLAAAGDLGGMALCLGRIAFASRHVLRGQEQVEVGGLLEDVLRAVDEQVDPVGADVPRLTRPERRVGSGTGTSEWSARAI